MREILKPVADMAVEISTAGSIARGWEVWEGEQHEEEKPCKPVVAKKGNKAKTDWREQYLWKRLEEIDKEVANEEKRAEVKRERAVERARLRKGAGANQPSILKQFKQVASNKPSRVHGQGARRGEEMCQTHTDLEPKTSPAPGKLTGSSGGPVPEQLNPSSQQTSLVPSSMMRCGVGCQ